LLSRKKIESAKMSKREAGKNLRHKSLSRKAGKKLKVQKFKKVNLKS
jgi:hypothetical protein